MEERYPIYLPRMYIRMGLIAPWDDGVNGLDAYKDAPTVAEIMQAMEISELFRKNVFETDLTAEWTSTFVQERRLHAGEILPKGYDPVTVIHRPEHIIYLWGEWIIEGGQKLDTFLPEEGWYVPENGQLISPYTGLPTQTVSTKEEAIVKLLEIMPFKRATSIVSMLKYDIGFKNAQVYRANGKHPIGAFRLRLAKLGHAHDEPWAFKLRPIQRNLEQILQN